eukprot:13245433-Ditylum_brightwellii.AAC.1
MSPIDITPPTPGKANSRMTSEDDGLDSYASSTIQSISCERELPTNNVVKDKDYKTNPFGPAVGCITGEHKCSYLNSA